MSSSLCTLQPDQLFEEQLQSFGLVALWGIPAKSFRNVAAELLGIRGWPSFPALPGVDSGPSIAW